MPPIQHVQPGEVIRAKSFNDLIDAINSLTSGAPGAGVAVPNLVGRTISQALSLLNQPSINLAVGFAIDVFGTVVNPNASSSGSRLVIMQSPPVGARVAAGTVVDLIIAGQGTTTPPPTQPPTITGTETLGGTTSTSFRVGDSLVIVGTHFNLSAAQNLVTFDGIPTTSVTSDPADPTRRLIVTVPTGIPGAPVNPGDPSRPGVVLTVTTGGVSATTTITVDAPSAQPPPQITGFNPTAVAVGQNVAVNGANFSPVVARNTVTFGTTDATSIVSATANQIVATMPNLPPTVLPPTPGSSTLVQVFVTVRDASNNPIGTAVSPTNLTVFRP